MNSTLQLGLTEEELRRIQKFMRKEVLAFEQIQNQILKKLSSETERLTRENEDIRAVAQILQPLLQTTISLSQEHRLLSNKLRNFPKELLTVQQLLEEEEDQ